MDLIAISVRRIFVLVLVALTTLTTVSAQNARETFGKNRIQYREFEWKSISSENFEYYFYGEGGYLSREAIGYLEEQFDMLTDIMGYPPYSKTKVFIYNSTSDLQQSNVGINFAGPISGGETQFAKSYIEIAHPGTVEGFKQELLYKVTVLLLNEMLYGGSLKDMLQSTFMNLPEWFTEGAAQYISRGWSVEMDDFVREYLRNENNVRLQKLSGHEARLIGQSIWNYIAERHGKSNISSILNYIRIIRNEEKSIEITLGMSFKSLINDWKSFYSDMDKRLDSHYSMPPEDLIFGVKNRKGLIYKNVKVSPDGMRIAYTKNDRGKFTVMLKDIATDEEKEIITGGVRIINQEVDYGLPLLSWVDDNTLGLISSKNGKLIFWLYDASSETKVPRELKNITQVNDMSFSANGRLGILSATVNGMSDLYLISTRRDRIRRLTNDIWDDVDPSFVPGTNTLLFISNRVSDTLNLLTKDINMVSGNYNLFFYNLDTTQNIVTRVTNTISRDVQPRAISSDEILYLSDQKGIMNLFKYKISSGIYSQLTNYKKSIKEYYVNPQRQTLTFISINGSNDQVYHKTQFDVDMQQFTPPSSRQQILQAKLLRNRKIESDQSKGLSVRELIDNRLKEIREQEEAEEEEKQTKEEILDTDNYTFEEEEDKSSETVTNTTESFLSQYRRMRQNSTIMGPYDYETLFSADKILTSFVIDPLRGFGMIIESQMNDLLENHRFGGGIMSTTDLRAGDIFSEYKYLKSHIDYSIRQDRKVVFWNKDGENPSSDRYVLNQLQFGASYPLNVRTRVGVYPYIMQTVYNDLGRLDRNGIPTSPPSFLPTIKNTYSGARIELVFDNSVSPGMNLQEGTRGKLSFIHYENLTNSDLSFSNLKLDFRHYQKIHREITFATRFFYGKFMGKSPKTYLLGGVDNWLFNRSNETGSRNPLNREIQGDRSDLLFTEYITTLRGFDYAELYGTDVLMFNAELRVPLVRYLNSGYISSNFFRNIQFIGFFDVGSSWTGKSPFNTENTITTEVIEEGAFQITINNFKNPWLASYGVGFRTMMLGYYMKFDLAWPLEDYTVSNPRLSVSLGFDF